MNLQQQVPTCNAIAQRANLGRRLKNANGEIGLRNKEGQQQQQQQQRRRREIPVFLPFGGVRSSSKLTPTRTRSSSSFGFNNNSSSSSVSLLSPRKIIKGGKEEVGQRREKSPGHWFRHHHPSPKMLGKNRAKIGDSGDNNYNNNEQQQQQLPEYIVDAATKTTYMKGKFLGKGGFARVYEFTDLTTNIVYAGKIIPKSRIVKPNHKEKIAREIDLHRKLKHEHVVRFHHFFSDDENVYIILENCSYKSLIHVLKNRGQLTEPEVRYYLHQLILGINYIHKKKVIHRDLKLGNMFLTDDLVVKIGDFGLASKIEENMQKKITVCGTPNYIAPEVLKKQGLGHKSDIWAVGCIMYAMLVGQPPFEMNTLKETYAKITSNSYDIPPLISDPARDLITLLLQADPKNRPEVSAILSHEFFKSGYFPKSLPVSSCTTLPKFTPDENSCSDSASAVGHRSSSERGIAQEVRKLSRIVPKLCISSSKPEAKGLIKDRLKVRSLSLGRNESLQNLLLQKVSTALRPDENFDKKSKYSVISDLFQLLSSCLAAMPEESSLKLVTDTTSPTLFVTKWIDYSNKYGFSFQLCDRSICMLLNDSTRISLSPDRSQMELHQREGKLSIYPISSIPSSLQFHYKLIKYLAKYMDEKLTEGGHPETFKRHWPPPYMSWWMRTDLAIVMQLSTGAVQINFFKDHTKVILSKSKDDAFLVTYFNQAQRPKTYQFLHLMMLGCPPALYQKLECLLKLLRDFKNLNGSSV